MKIYAFSGLGADHRVFQYLKLNYELIPLPWIKPRKRESIESYAMRISENIDTSAPFALLGVSFGGLIAVEVAKISNPEITILISSAETKYEISLFNRILGKLQLPALLPESKIIPPFQVVQKAFGTQQTQLLKQIILDTDKHFAKWALSELMNWKNTEKIEPVLKISGTHDKVMPPADRKNTILIKSAGHFMIVDRADEVSSIINSQLEKMHSQT